MRELYPDIRVKLFYARDFRALMLKFGRLGLADVAQRHVRARSWPTERTGPTGVVPRPASHRRAGMLGARPRRRGRGSRRADRRGRATRSRAATSADRSRRPAGTGGHVAEAATAAGSTSSPTSARSSSARSEIAAKVAELGAPDRGRLRRPAADARVSVLKGSLPFMADLMRAIPCPLRIDLMEVSSYGGAVDRVVGPRPDPQGPVGDDRGRGRPDRRGHHRHRPDPQLPDALPARQEPGARSGSARSSTSRPGGSSTSRSTTSASRSPTSSSSATASTTASSTATCASWASCAPRSTRAPTDDAPTTPRGRATPGRHRRAHRRSPRCFLPWWQIVGDLGLPPARGNAFDGSGVLVFFAALAIIALIALPYAAGDVPVGLDRPLSFLILAVVGWVALVVRLVDLASPTSSAILPQRAYGLWIAASG